MGETILLVDDDALIRRSLGRVLRRGGLTVADVGDGVAAIERLGRGDVACVITDLMMPGSVDGMAVLEHARSMTPAVEVIMMTAHATVESAVKALKAGAYDYLLKPLEDIGAALRVVERALEKHRLVRRNRHLEASLDAQSSLGELVGSSAAMRSIFTMIKQVAWSTSTVLVEGESGTGKELVAQAIHANSTRRDRPFVPVNCGSLSESLLESELFGHEKGAFTGAVSSRRGLFEAADGGTLFLDEVGELSPAMQVRLLRALNNGEIKRVGSSQARQFDVRVIAATHRDLERLVRDERFREDLYFRLNVIPIRMPPLRERTEDIELLAHHLLTRHAAALKVDVPALEERAIRALKQHPWPGNVRELENALERALVLSRGQAISLASLPTSMGPGTQEQDGPTTYQQARHSAMVHFERKYFLSLLEQTGGNKARAARLAKMDRANFRRALKRHPDLVASQP